MKPFCHRQPNALAASLAAVFLLVATAASAAAPPTSARNMPQHDMRLDAPVHGDAHAGSGKVDVCAACHGKDGMAASPAFPNLAGQSATYLYLQMRAFKEGWRENASMQPMVAPLSDQDMRDIAAWYASLSPQATSHDAASDKEGAELYHHGDPSRGIPGCQGCHGPAGHGPRPDPHSTAPQPAWHTFPRLAGQSPVYVLTQLKAYRDGTRNGSSNTHIMHGVSTRLSDEDMQALADYIAAMQP